MNQEIKPLKAVYSYFFPEVRKILEKVDPAEVNKILLRSVTPGLDDFHHGLIVTYQKYFSQQLPQLDVFAHKYITAGASEGIFHTLAKLAAENRAKPVYVLKGEYEGYAGYGRNLGLNIVTVDNPTDFGSQDRGTIYISNPSARDGNIIDDNTWQGILESGHDIVYDATYVGLTQPYQFLTNHPAIKVVLCSLSKPFGLYYHRIGLAFSRVPLPTLEVNKWFKNINSLVLAQNVLEGIPESELVTRYRPFQDKAIAQMGQQYGIRPEPSDVILLASSKQAPESLQEFNRGDNYRFCLTPYFLKQEEEENAKSRKL